MTPTRAPADVPAAAAVGGAAAGPAGGSTAQRAEASWPSSAGSRPGAPSIAAALVPLIGMRIVRGLRTGQMPVYRTYLDRDGNEGKFYALLALNGAALILVAVIAADLLLGLNLRNAP